MMDSSESPATDPDNAAPGDRPTSRNPPGFKIVGIGASAGGLGALKTLFGQMSSELGVAYVVVVHLSPEHKSLLAELLQPHCSMPVEQVAGDVKLEPNRVYVIPPAANLNTIDTHLRLSELEPSRQQRAPIDHFFRTLAETHGPEAVGLVLTGTGSDGTQGLRWIKDQGGVTIAQSPADAEYDGMPRNAIASGEVDIVLSLREIPEYLKSLVETVPDLPDPVDLNLRHADHDRNLHKIFAQIRARTGHDFSQYKVSTILRRIRRRMQLQKIAQLPGYLDLLRTNRHEIVHLFDDLLITVTEFFRDAEVFDLLEKDVIPRLFEGKDNGPVRVWSVGCSTGEEAYSLAMLLFEEADRRDVHPTIQIFASDLHDKALKSAREGLYPESIAANISPERLKRFFTKDNGAYRVRREVRELVVFAPHDLLKDPPFSHLDLVVCRNLLIYLQRDIQQEIVSLFHYALNDGGTLLLGSAETVEDSDLFICEDKKHCLFRRRSVPTREPRLPMFAIPRRHHLPEGEPERAEPGVSFGAMHARIVEQYAPPSVLLSQSHEIVHYSARAGRYFGQPGGEPTNNVFKLVLEPLRVELRGALHDAREQGRPIRGKPLAITLDGQRRYVVLRVHPAVDSGLDGFTLVIFDELEDLQLDPRAAVEGQASPGVQELEAELQMSKQRMQAVIEEYETGQEEMQASNEELQSANEELRSTLEELETSKEELQSMNEELATVNQENRHRVEELAQLTSDLTNLLAATDIATLFLDRDLRIVRFTPRVGELFNIRHSDKGRPLSDLTHRLGDSKLLDDARSVLDRLVPVERELRSENGRCYLSRVLPYRTADDHIAGVVVTLIDITEQVKNRGALAVSEERYRSLFNSIDEGFCVVEMMFDEQEQPVDYRFLETNPAFEKQTGISNAVGRRMREIAPDHEQHWFDTYGKVAKTGEAVRFENTAEALGRHYDVYAFRLGPAADRRVAIVFNDVTERKKAVDALREADRRKDEFLATLAHELRNPLAPLASGLELLKTVAADHQECQEIRGTMERQVRQLVRLVDDLMDVSRITRGRLKLRKATCELSQVVNDAVAETRPLFEGDGHELSVVLPERPVSLFADAARLTQIVSNLLSNAAKYTPEGGHIQLSATREGKEAVICVQDDGIGIPADMRDRIFDMFSQVNPQARSEYIGMGIGLTLVKSLVEMHSGTVSVASEGEGQGATFSVRLPIRRSRKKAEPADQSQQPPDPGGRRVLIVDDNQAAAKLLKKIVELMGNEVLVAFDGPEALKTAKDFQPEIILLDLGMPKMDGYEVARRIRRQTWGKDVRLIALSGWGADDDKRKTQAAGFDEHLVKPADVAAIEVALSPQRSATK